MAKTSSKPSTAGIVTGTGSSAKTSDGGSAMTALVTQTASAGGLMPIDATVTKDDIVAITMVAAEKRIHQQVAEAKTAAEYANKQACDHATALRKLLQPHAEDVLGERVAAAAAAMVALLGYGKPSVQIMAQDALSPAGEARRIEGTKPAAGKPLVYAVHVRFGVATSSHRDGKSFDHGFHVYATTEMLALIAKRDAAYAMANAATERALTWKKKLGQLGQIERQTRASLAVATLSRTEEGKHLAAQLTAGLDEALDKLG